MENFEKGTDVIDLILDDHKSLKQLIKTLKSDAEFEEKFLCFEEFAPMLTMHAKPEEQTIYVSMKKDDDEESRIEALEGDIEHGLADQLVEELKRTTDQDMWMAKVKVLAELVEHHIEEEEEELLPTYKENSELEERQRLAVKFMQIKEELGEQNGEDAPSEISMNLLAQHKNKKSNENARKH